MPPVKEAVERKPQMDDPVILGREEEVKPKEVTIELDDKGQVVKPEVKKVEEPKYFDPKEVEKITENAVKKATAPLYYELRQLKERKPEPVIQRAPEVPADEWDLKVQKDWKGTVRELARLEATEMRKQEIEQQRVVSENQKKLNLLNQNKQRVMEKHPDLDDPTSEKARVFQEVLQKNPDYLYNEFGPVLAMREMEDEMRSRGIVDDPTKQIVDKEVARQNRTRVSQVPQGQQTNGSKKYVMSSSDKEFCDIHKIKYETFIQNQQRMAKSEGVEA